MFFLKFLLALALTLPASALAGTSTPFEGGQATLVAEHESLSPNGVTSVGWLIELEPGWHTYWKNAGDTGLGAQIKWQGADVGATLWPAPAPISVNPFMSYGYENEVLFSAPFSAEGLKISDEILLSSHIQFLVCKEICLPVEATGTLLLPVKAEASVSSFQTLFAKVREMVPTPLEMTKKVRQSETDYFIPLNEDMRQGARFIPAAEDVIDDSAPQKIVSLENGLYLKVAKESYNPIPIKTLDGILQSGDKNWSISIAFAPSSAAPLEGVMNAASLSLSALIPFLMAAFVAGIILNLMPCVLPVIGLKVLHLSQHRSFGHVASFTGGVLSAFWAMAAAVYALKGTGEIIGWGFHLQNIYFVSFLIILLLLVALNLLGTFEIRVALTTQKEKKGILGGFTNGWLVALLATPCTAPFMGAAVGVAFTQSLPVMVSIFSGLGLGLAFPYAAIACVPGLQRLLPKPGGWMVRFKQFLAFPILATALWLVWVAINLGGNIIYLLSFGLFIAFMAWVYGLKHNKIAGVILVVSIALAVAFPWVKTNTKTNLEWQVWSHELEANARATGRPVFINFTADWCITCKVNETVVFRNNKVATEVKNRNMLLLKADWTNQNSTIAAELASYGRAGVPLYIYYPSGQDAVTLPQLLTPSIWLNYIKGNR